MRKETVNTFIKGLNLDSNNLIVDNQTLVDALNATTITFNGNEHVLQNDMGNGRIHNARLKPGFVPVGIKEHGGIVYIASHNPFSGESELGSFPSPERNLNYNNITSSSQVYVSDWIQNSTCEGVVGDNINSTKYFVAALKSGTKDIYLNPGDLFKLIITGADASFYKANTTYFEVNNSPAINDKMLAEGRVRPINFDITIRKNDGSTEYITKSILKNGLLNDVISFGGSTSNSNGETNLSNEEALNQYRNAVNSGYSIYSGKSSGYLNFVISLNTLEGFNVSHSYVQYPENNSIKYKIILKVFVPSKYKKGVSYGSNSYLYLADTKVKATLRGSNIEFNSIKKEDPNYVNKIKALLNIKGDKDIPSSYKSDNLFEVLYVDNIVKTDGENIFEYSIVPKSNIAYECFNAKKGIINLNTITDAPFKLNRWNYKTNLGTNYPLRLNLGYQGSLNENLLNKIKEVRLTPYDIYHDHPLGFGFILPNNGDNFNNHTRMMPYYQIGSGGPLDVKTNIKEEQDILEEYYNTINQNDINTHFINLDISKYIDIDKVENKHGLLKNNLYLFKVELIDDNNDILNTDYRFLYTSNVFDKNNEVDFVELKPDKILLDEKDLLNDGEKGIKASYVSNANIYQSTIEKLNTYNKYKTDSTSALVNFIQEGKVELDLFLDVNKNKLPFGDIAYNNLTTNLSYNISVHRKSQPSYSYSGDLSGITNTNNNSLDLPNGDFIINENSSDSPTVSNTDIRHKLNYKIGSKADKGKVSINGIFKYLIHHVDLLELEKTTIENYGLVQLNSSEIFSQTEKFSTNGYSWANINYISKNTLEKFNSYNPYRYKDINKFLYSDLSSGIGYGEWTPTRIFDNAPIQNAWGIFAKATGYETDKKTIEISSMLSGFAYGAYSRKKPLHNKTVRYSGYISHLRDNTNNEGELEYISTGIRFKHDDSVGQGLFMHMPFGIREMYNDYRTFEYATLASSFGYEDKQLYHAFTNLIPLVYHNYSNKIVVLNQLLNDSSLFLNNFYKKSSTKIEETISGIVNTKKIIQDTKINLKINSDKLSLINKNNKSLYEISIYLKGVLNSLNTNNIDFDIKFNTDYTITIEDKYDKKLITTTNAINVNGKLVTQDYFNKPISLNRVYVLMNKHLVDLKDYSKYYKKEYGEALKFYIQYDEEKDYVEFKTVDNPNDGQKASVLNFLTGNEYFDKESKMFVWTPLLFDYDGALNVQLKESIINNAKHSIINYAIYNSLQKTSNGYADLFYMEQRLIFNNLPLYVPSRNNRLSIHPYAYSINLKRHHTDHSYSLNLNNRSPLIPYTNHIYFTGEQS